MDVDYSEVPKKWTEEFKGKNPDEASAELSYHRTQLSTHRTFMSNARSHMSNERTHLSYLRTALSLMTFGITLNRFSIYLRQSKIIPTGYQNRLMLYETEIVGIGIVILGIIILCWALFRYRQVNKAIETDTFKSPEIALTILTAGILILGGLITIWMFVGWF